MYLKTLTLNNFKNYKSQKMTFSPKLNSLTGLNGMGKTNVLDAIYYLCMCKSHFNINDAHLVNQGEDFFRLEGQFSLVNNKKSKIVAKVQPKKLKVFEHDGVEYQKLSEHIGKIPIVMIAPDDTILLTEGSEERRRLMDITLSQLDQNYINQLLTYNKLIEQRNALLKQFAQNNVYNEKLLEVYNEQLFSPTDYIYQKRQWLIEVLSPIFQSYYKIISGDREQPSCRYESKLSEYSMQDILSNNLDKDRVLQRTTGGIHRDDLVFTFLDGSPAKRFASQGQLKSFLLSIKLAQYEVLRLHKKTFPILLLDDIFDKLDAHRVAHLVGLLSTDNFGQIFITDTQTERIEDILRRQKVEFQSFIIESGTASMAL